MCAASSEFGSPFSFSDVFDRAERQNATFRRLRQTQGERLRERRLRLPLGVAAFHELPVFDPSSGADFIR